MNAQEIIQQITEKVEKTSNVKVLFGDPIKQGDVTVIPVGSVNIRGGGGGGMTGSEELADKEQKRGMGIGVVVKVNPLGYIELKNNETKFIGIMDITKLLVAATIAGVMMMLFALKTLAVAGKVRE